MAWEPVPEEEKEKALAARGKWEKVPDAEKDKILSMRSAVRQDNPIPEARSRFMEGVGDIAQGAAQVGASILDAPFNVVNLAKAGYGTIKGALGGTDLPEVSRPPLGYRLTEGVAKVLPGSEPETVWQNIIKRSNELVGATLAGGGLRGLVGNTAMSAAAGGVGGAAQFVAPDSPGAQMVAELTIPATALLAQKAVRSGLAGPETAQNVRTIRESGAEPTVAQVGQTGTGRTLEGLSGQGLGGREVLHRRARENAERMGARIEEIADSISPANTPSQAGRAITRGTNTFIDQFKGKWRQMDAELSAHFAPDDPVSVSNTLTKLRQMSGATQGAENTMQVVGSQKVRAILEALESDAPNGVIRYEALRKLRSAIGEKAASANLKDDISTGEYKAIYAALSEDIGAAARAKGADAEKAWSRQNAYYKAGSARIEKILEPLDKDLPEQVYTIAMQGADKGGTKLFALRKSLPSSDWDDVVSTVVSRMGQGKNGFSIDVFLTDYSKKLSPEAKAALFGANTKLRRDLETIAKSAKLQSEAGAVYANPSGSAVGIGSVAGAGAGISAGVSAVTGDYPTAIGLALFAAAPYITARMMTSQKFVNFLAGSTKIPREKWPAYAARLMSLAESTEDPELKQDLQNYMEAVK